MLAKSLSYTYSALQLTISRLSTGQWLYESGLDEIKRGNLVLIYGVIYKYLHLLYAACIVA